MYRLNSLTAAVSGLFLVLVSACGGADSAGPNAKQLSVSFTTGAKAAPSVLRGGGVSFFTQTVGSNTLVLDKAQIVLSKLELTTAPTAMCTGDNSTMGGASADEMSGGSSECEELRADPSLVDLPTDNTIVTTLLVTSVPAGTYTDFEAKVHVVQSTDLGGAAFLAAHPTFAGVSVHAEGTFNGNHFTYDGTANAKLEVEFATPLVVDASGMNITVNVDLGSWFVDGTGALIDPTTANMGGANEALVVQNIHQSFDAFEDDNHDGKDDSTEGSH